MRSLRIVRPKFGRLRSFRKPVEIQAELDLIQRKKGTKMYEANPDPLADLSLTSRSAFMLARDAAAKGRIPTSPETRRRIVAELREAIARRATTDAESRLKRRAIEAHEAAALAGWLDEADAHRPCELNCSPKVRLAPRAESESEPINSQSGDNCRASCSASVADSVAAPAFPPASPQ
jgi:hypothetical protein